MGMNDTPRSDRVHIALFGRRNAGKSSLINAITGQEISLVSAVKGTTTDPVYKAMELLPIGPVVFIDTAGLDDEGELGELRKKKSLDVLFKTDVAIIVMESGENGESGDAPENGVKDFNGDLNGDSLKKSNEGDSLNEGDNQGDSLKKSKLPNENNKFQNGTLQMEKDIIVKIRNRNIPMIGVINKIDCHDVSSQRLIEMEATLGIKLCTVSTVEKKGISELKNAIVDALPNDENKFTILGDLVSPGDFVVLVTPIDKSAPKGRLILPQQQVIRDALESDCIAVVTKEFELKDTLDNLGKKPKLVITDSQVFLKVAADTPKDIAMTSFSILFARQKGNLPELVRGAAAVESLKDGDKILIAEACTHHQQADDIGRVKIPRWLRQMTGKQLEFEFTSGIQFSENIKQYALVVHCGGCMINKRAMCYRIEQAVDAGVPIVNYGILIAYVQGILERAIRPFPSARLAWEEQKEQTNKNERK